MTALMWLLYAISFDMMSGPKGVHAQLIRLRAYKSTWNTLELSGLSWD